MAVEVQHATAEAGNLVAAAASNKCYKNGSGSNLIFFIKQLQGLMAAAFTISNTYPLLHEAIVPPDKATGLPDIGKQQHFAQPAGIPAWVAFPRHLSAGQYCNPYKAIKKFTGHCTQAAWQNILEDMLEYALSRCPADEEYAAGKLLLIRLRLLQLIEACHLIYIRTMCNTKPLKKITKKK
ncbi:hypothetical protein GCM10027043_32770 [Ferruginibacter profundus]